MEKIFLPQQHPIHDLKQPALWFIFKKEEILLLHKTLTKIVIPQYIDITDLDLKIEQQCYLGVYQNFPCYAVEVENDQTAPPSMLFQSLRDSYDTLFRSQHSEDLFSIASRAKQILHWDRITQFCGHCGYQTHQSEKERAKVCSMCNTFFYPHASPVILVLVWRKNEILLARSPHFKKNIYSVLAGFVEPGETLEYTAEREVQEEVGVQIKNLRYFSSQPWPFPSNLMVGFIAEYDKGEIIIDPIEIEDAQWFNFEKLPLLPNPMSLSRRMIDSFSKNLGPNGPTDFCWNSF